MGGRVSCALAAVLAGAITTGLFAESTAAQTPPSAHDVGVVSETFVDRSRPTAANRDCPEISSRTLPTTIYYPAGGSPASRPVTAQPGAAPDTRDGPFPLIVFAHGFSATARTYEKLLEHLASAGYVVAAPTFPLSSGDSPCGPIAGDVVNQPEDLTFVIDAILKASAAERGSLAGIVDDKRIGAAGHSNGAVTTWGLVANSTLRDPRIDAAVIMAGTLQRYPEGRYQFSDAPPVLLIHGRNDAQVPYDLGVQAYNEARGPKGLLSMTNGDHGSAAGANGYGATTDFFDAYLKGDTAAKARLPTDGLAGVSEMQFDAEKGSTTTIATAPRPAQNLKATVTPRKNLSGGQTVTVKWSGYTPGKVVNILQCDGMNRDLTNSTMCDYANAKLLYPNPTGAGEVQLTIVAGPVGTGTCDAQRPKCIIVVNNASSSDPRDSVILDISLKK